MSGDITDVSFRVSGTTLITYMNRDMTDSMTVARARACWTANLLDSVRFLVYG
jgi:hypothetical protein